MAAEVTAAEAEILDELRRLRARVPQLTGSLASGVDGLVLAQDTPGSNRRAWRRWPRPPVAWPCS